MLGAQALRTKQKVDQKEREKRQKGRQRNLEIQRERIQRAAHEDAQAAMLEYAAAAAAEAAAATSASTSGGDPNEMNDSTSPIELAQRFHQLAIGGAQVAAAAAAAAAGGSSNSGAVGYMSGQSPGGVNRKIRQRYSLNAASYHQMPSSARDSFNYERVQIPQRSPSTDCGSAMSRSARSGSSGQAAGILSNRFLRWLRIGNSPSVGHMSYESGVKLSKHIQHNDGAATERRDSRQSSAEKRRMSTY